jgi:hypothetical protein
MRQVDSSDHTQREAYLAVDTVADLVGLSVHLVTRATDHGYWPCAILIHMISAVLQGHVYVALHIFIDTKLLFVCDCKRLGA